jgi:hypothetical protein
MGDEGLFGDRRKALEEAFFAKQNEALVAKLRAAEEKRGLGAAAGIQSQILLDKLHALGLAPETLLALGLVPLIEVAWADGHIDARERAAILEASEKQGVQKGTASYDLLQSWIDRRPTPDLIQAWEGYLDDVLERLDEKAGADLERALIGRARNVASAAGGILGLGSKISATEQAVIDRLEKRFAARR